MLMVFIVFVLGFVADPIINIYMDPYDSLRGRESIWEELEISSDSEEPVSAWTQHFAKGLISMGLVGFLKTLVLNPFQWINLRWGGSSWTTGHNRAATGRDRAVNISWIAVIIGVTTTISNHHLGWNPSSPSKEEKTDQAIPVPQTEPQKDMVSATTLKSDPSKEEQSEAEPAPVSAPEQDHGSSSSQPDESTTATVMVEGASPLMSGSWIDVNRDSSSEDNNVLSGVHRQGWSFSNL
ncbi:hypothetical protein MRB53_039190 [Persea americana]|nr:hypothetical protein MRB53_039190 [Persea americana]